MKKKLLSMILALVMLLTVLPLPSRAAMYPLEETGTESAPESGESAGTPENGETPPAEGDGETPPEEVSELLIIDLYSAVHPTHVTIGEVDLSGTINPNSGKLSFTKGTITPTGSVKVSSWSVSTDAKLTFTLSSGKTGDTIEFTIDVSSEKFAGATLKVTVTLGYEKLMITSGTTMTYGQTMTLTCVGTKGNGAVLYSVADGTGSATISGNVLTATKAGSVMVSAIQVRDGNEAAEPSDSVVITISKATPTATASHTALKHAGQTLEDAALTLKNSSVPGTLDWVLPDNTPVIANTAYEWEFTPDDTTNYNAVKGTITPYVVTDSDFVIGSGVTELNPDGSYTTTSFGEDDSSYKLTEYPDGSMKMVHTQMDGTVTTTVQEADGTRTQTIKKKDGSRQVTATDKSGVTYTNIVDKYGYATMQVYLPTSITAAAARSGNVIRLPIPEIPCTDDRSDAPVITFTLSTTSPVRVSIPINSPTAGTVAILVDKNGKEEIVMTSTTGYDAVEVTLSGSTTIKVADLSKRFLDVDHRHWYKDAADFATSRGLFNGVSHTHFDADGYMSRAMLVTVLYNLEGKPYGDFGFYYGYYGALSDVKGKWYETATTWAINEGHISGFEDSTFRGEEYITREQLAMILYRYAGYPSVKSYVNSSLTDYLDYATISPYAYEAMQWAACSGVLYNAGRDKLSPKQPVTRGEVAQTFKNLVEFLVK